MSRLIHSYEVLDAKQAVGIGNKIFVGDHRHKQMDIGTAGMGAGDTITVKVQGSFSLEAPDFTAAKSASNRWDYIQIVDNEDGSAIDGDTGITFSDSNDLRQFLINIDGLRWVSLEVTAISDGVNTSVSADLHLFND